MIAWLWFPVGFVVGAAVVFVSFTRLLGGTNAGQVISSQQRRIEELQDDLEISRTDYDKRSN